MDTYLKTNRIFLNYTLRDLLSFRTEGRCPQQTLWYQHLKVVIVIVLAYNVFWISFPFLIMAILLVVYLALKYYFRRADGPSDPHYTL